MEIKLNEDLELIEPRRESKGEFINRISPENAEDIKNEAHGIHHSNFMYYLLECYKNHLGYILSPEIIWHEILSEIAGHIVKNPDKYRELFTTSDESQQILMLGGPEDFDPNYFVARLKKLIPTDADLFLPEFSTSTPASNLATNAVFCEAMTPYYHYGMYMCGYPKVDIRGTEEDWGVIIDRVMIISKLSTELHNYVGKFIGHLSAFKWNSCLGECSLEKESFQNILVPKRCGSGSQEELSGWFTDFYIEKPSFTLAQNFPTHIANVPFKFINNDTDHVYLSGLFKSYIKDGYLIPEFDSQILNIKEKEDDVEVEEEYEIVAYKDELPEMGIDIVKSEVKPSKILTSDANGSYFWANYITKVTEILNKA